MITGIGALIIGLLAGWFLFGGSGHKIVDEHEHGLERTDQIIWTCSMHPQIRRNEPGNCPICGMELIPLESEEGEDTDPMAIRMSPTAMQLASVRTALVGEMAPVKTVRLNGKVQADQRLVFSQSSHIPGRIENLMVNFTGEFVNKGQTIALVYSPELVTAQEELFEAFKMKDRQPQLFSAAKQKLKNWKLSDHQVEEILKSGKIQTNFAIRADVAGYVTDKLVNHGDYIQKGKAVYQITDLSKVWVLFDVYESDMPWIKKGDVVEFIIPSLPGERFQGPIIYLDPVIDPKTRVSKARVEITNHELRLKPEMFVSGTVKAELHKQADVIAVPATAVMWTGKRSIVHVKTESDKGVHFKMREVTLGPFLGEHYIVEQGLRKGEEIAVHGTFSIDAAAQLAGKPSMMRPEGGPEMTGHDHGGGDKPASHPEPEPEQPAITSQVIGQKAKDALQPVYSQYLNYKDALAADNLEQAFEAASLLQSRLSEIDMALFTGKSHDAWMQHSRDMENRLQHLPHLKTIEELRKTFQHVSEAMIALTLAFTPLDQTLYVQHCPMVDNNKGADWLSLDKEIINPYFGKSMLTCGEVTMTIN